MLDLYSVIVFISLFLLLITISDISENKLLVKDRKNKLYLVCICIGIAIFCEWLGVYLNGAPVEYISLHKAIKFIEFCITPMIALTAIMAYGIEKYLKLNIIIILMHIIFEFISLYNNWVFSIDCLNLYHREKYFLIYIIIFFISIFCFFISVWKNGKKYQMSMDNTLILTLFLIFFSLVIQMCNPDIRVAYLCIAFGNFIFYNRYCKMVLQIDSITLLLNRKCYDANLGNMDLNSIILFFDVDNFKNVNDVYGHLIGDFCLKEISQIIREVYDKYGCCYRIGGDEFSVILSNYNGDIKILNDMFIQKLNEKCDKDSRIPDVSIGWSYYNENFSYMSDVIKEADFMMYENKRKKLK